MAIFTPGPLIGGISGAVGGQVFVNARGTKVLRHRPAVKGGNSPNHGTAQGNFQRAQNKWQTLTAQQRAAWHNYAPQVPTTNRLGQKSTLSAFQTFVRFNVRLQQHDLPMVTLPHSTFSTHIPNSVDLSATVASGVQIATTPDIAPLLYKFLLYGALNMSLSVPKAYTNWKLLGIVTHDGDGPLNINTIWDAAWPRPQLAQPLAARFDFYTSEMRREISGVRTAITQA